MLTGYIRKAPCSLLPTYGRPRLIAIIVRPYHQMSLSFKKTAQCWITAYNKAAGVVFKYHARCRQEKKERNSMSVEMQT